MSERLSTYGDSQLPTVGEVHVSLTTRWMVPPEVHLPVRTVESPIVADPPLQRPQLGPSEPARVSILKPLQDSCRTQLTVRIRQEQRRDVTLPYISERVQPRPPVPPLLRRQRSTLPSHYQSLTRGGRCRRCLLCLSFHQLLPQ